MPDNTEKPNDPPNGPLAPVFEPQWDWHDIERVLIIRLRSIGDAVLTTPSITALRRFLPDARIDILLEDWVAPVLYGFEHVDNVISFKPGKIFERMRLSRALRKTKYDLVYNMHGGSTSAFFTAATGAKHRVGFGHYRYAKTYNHLCIPAAEYWQSTVLQSAEQHLAMLGWTGVPVSDRPKTSLAYMADADITKLQAGGMSGGSRYALFHPAAAFESKQWPIDRFARTAEYLASQNISTVAVAGPGEEAVLEKLRSESAVPIVTITDAELPVVTAIAARACVFVGNDSGIAHIAAAVKTPCVVIFGPSNIDHWRPFTDAPNEVLSSESGINGVSVESVLAAIDKVIQK